MKHTSLIVVVLLAAVTVVVPAQTPWFGTQYQPGNVAVSLGLDGTLGGGIGAAAYPGIEFIFAKARPGDLFSIDFGAGAKGSVSFWNSFTNPTYGFFSFGGAGFLSAHFGLRGFTGSDFAEYLDRLDIFTALGLGYAIVFPTGDWGGFPPTSGLRIVNFSGVSYYLTDQIAITLGSNYYYGFGGSSNFSGGIGFVYKTGPKEEIGERLDIGTAGLSGDMMYLNFASLYWASIALGGYLPSDDTFAVGDGIRFVHSYRDTDTGKVTETEFTRALLHANNDGSKWWRLEFTNEDESFAFEALVDTDGQVTLLRYLDSDTNQVVTYTPKDPSKWQSYDTASVTAEDLASIRVGSERVTVKAGTFQCDKYQRTDDEYTYTWWISSQVPGRVVKFDATSNKNTELSGELREILHNVTTPWTPAW